MPNMKSRLRSELVIDAEKTALLAKIKALYDQRPSRLKFEIGSVRFNATEATDVTFDPTAEEDQIQFQRPNSALTGSGKEETSILCVADDGALEASSVTAIADTGAKATASLDLTADITLTSALMGTTRNTTTFTTQVLAAAANPSDTVLVAFTGTAGAITCTVTPNNGDNNAATPVDLTTAELTELINTGVVVGKTVTLTDGSTLRTKQTATGGGATAMADSGEGDGVVATFSAGANSNLNSTYFNFSDALDAHKYYAWFNVNGEGVDPTVATRTGVPIALSAGASANTIATALRAAIGALGSSAYFTTGGSSAITTITNKKVGNSTNTADGVAPTGFTISTTTPGHASALNSSYFIAYSAEDATKHYFWFNVNSEGVDPAVAASTGHAIVVAAGASATAVATALNTAIDGDGDFVSTRSGATVTMHNAVAGASTDVADGTAPTGFTINKLGELENYSTDDITMIKRLRNKKWLIRLGEGSDPLPEDEE